MTRERKKTAFFFLPPSPFFPSPKNAPRSKFIRRSSPNRKRRNLLLTMDFQTPSRSLRCKIHIPCRHVTKKLKLSSIAPPNWLVSSAFSGVDCSIYKVFTAANSAGQYISQNSDYIKCLLQISGRVHFLQPC